MYNPNQTRKTIHVSLPIAAAGGLLVGVAAYTAGLKTGFKLNQLMSELQAHQMIMLRLRESNPELVDGAVTAVIEQITGAVAAANPVA